MSRALHTARNGIMAFLGEFFGQVIAAIILAVAFVAWVYFDTILAGLVVVVLGLGAWGALSRMVVRPRKRGEDRGR